MIDSVKSQDTCCERRYRVRVLRDGRLVVTAVNELYADDIIM